MAAPTPPNLSDLLNEFADAVERWDTCAVQGPYQPTTAEAGKAAEALAKEVLTHVDGLWADLSAEPIARWMDAPRLGDQKAELMALVRRMIARSGPRPIDLSLPEDLADPRYKLLGIVDYCRLLTGYEHDARRWWNEQDQCVDARRWMDNGNEGAKELWEHHAKTAGQYETHTCEPMYAKLRELCNAALPLMPDVAERLKVLAFGEARLHRDRSTDWQAFTEDLKAIAARARGLLHNLEQHPAETMAERFQWESAVLVPALLTVEVRKVNARLQRWREEDPEYRRRWTALQADPECVRLCTDLKDHPPTGDLYADCRFQALAKLKVQYGLMGWEPTINTPEKLEWWLNSKKDLFAKSLNRAAVSSSHVEEGRDFILQMRRTDPTLPALPTYVNNPQIDYQNLLQWCIDARTEKVGGEFASALATPDDESANVPTITQPRTATIDPQPLPHLSERQQGILLTLLDLQAFDSDSRQRTEDIAPKVEQNADPAGFKSPVADLREKGLVDTKTGRNGGCWLTLDGRARAERLKKR